jgi:hypothetical protein
MFCQQSCLLLQAVVSKQRKRKAKKKKRKVKSFQDLHKKILEDTIQEKATEEEEKTMKGKRKVA